MVKVRQQHPQDDADQVDIQRWTNELIQRHEMAESDAKLLLHASEFTRRALTDEFDPERLWNSATGCLNTGLEMAEILAELSLDTAALQAAILYRAIREGRISLDKVRREFGNEVAGLIDKVLRMAVISTISNAEGESVFGHVVGQQANKTREMLVSIIDDIRVPLIKIAERTCAIRAVKTASSDKQIRVAREVVDVYAPLAHRLGLGNLKWELEDLAFRYLQPLDYATVASLLAEKRRDRQAYIAETIRQVEAQLNSLNIEGEVSGRPKHIYSIWSKMQRKNLSFTQVYDIRALRVLVPTVADCYAVLGWMHSRWENLPSEYDDYIAAPKENGYRSLHTAVIGPEEKVLEIQIRTFDMHNAAELGVCAHWRYKGSSVKSADKSYEEKIEWLRHVLDWSKEIERKESTAQAQQSVSEGRVYVFTPEGHVVDLPVGATPLDFAYYVHTDLGHRCRGAKVNGRIVPLSRALRTGDQVSIITARQGEPSRDWLSASMGYLKTSRARSKVQYWFRKQNQEHNQIEGKKLLERELAQLNISGIDLQKAAQRFNKQGIPGLYAAIGAGDVGVEQVINSLQSRQGKNRSLGALDSISSLEAFDSTAGEDLSTAQRFKSSDVFIHGVGNLLTQMARCCRPLPGDGIGGYITQGRGISIHRQDCGNFLRLQGAEPQRIIKVEWGGQPQKNYRVKIALDTYDRSGLLLDITKTVDRLGLHIASMTSDAKTRRKRAMNSSHILLALDVPSLDQLSAVLSQLNQIPNVVAARRVSD
ncbi:MAG: bifunctional (p)ppGpp synthetase/guanosine-3',5'-bis(diphosphate) 3'-pyrophosphohydrolase [Porticoccaceae bacterium]|nr:bifunctional (p)ppGpp synthetase/guanosine-3',5'-bis(diphosphate) 3'-pyrophosphohydrolase [Porticoccaceae bacterium]